MKPIDFIILIPLIYGAYEGYKKGFVLVIVGFFALILGIIGGFKLLQLGIDFLEQFFPHMPKMLPLLSFILIFCLIVFAVYMLGVVLKKTLELTVFAGILDKIAGGIAGLCQWAFTISILIWFVKQSHMIVPDKYIRDAPVFNFLATIAPRIINLFDFLMPFASDLFKQIRENF